MKTSRKSKTICVVALSGLLFAAASCSKTQTTTNEQGTAAPSPAERKITSVGVVKARPQNIEVAAGEKVQTSLRLVIEKGFHVNANPPTYPYLIATELQIQPAEGITIGKVTYPTAMHQKFGFAEQPLAVYEGEQDIKVELWAAKSIDSGQRTLNAVLRIQACDDQVCYPPGTIDLQIPLTVK